MAPGDSASGGVRGVELLEQPDGGAPRAHGHSWKTGMAMNFWMRVFVAREDTREK